MDNVLDSHTAVRGDGLPVVTIGHDCACVTYVHTHIRAYVRTHATGKPLALLTLCQQWEGGLVLVSVYEGWLTEMSILGHRVQIKRHHLLFFDVRNAIEQTKN